jgi:acetyltransferase-like isoleucine patch superfamily enzyme
MKPFLNSRTSEAGRSISKLVDRGPAVARRWGNLHYYRALYGRTAFGDGCDIGKRCRVTLRDGGRVSFGPGCVIDEGMTLEVTGLLRVGAGTVFGHHCTIAARSAVTLGSSCLIAEMVSIRDHDHNFERLDTPVVAQGAVVSDVTIGDNVWLGAKVNVLRGVTIGDNVVVGAGAVVTHDIPANAVAVGVPARVLRFRSPADVDQARGAAPATER